MRRSISDAKVGASGPSTAADLQAQGLLSSAIFGKSLDNRGGWLGRTVGGGVGGLLGHAIGGVDGGLLGASIGSGVTDAIGAVNSRVAAKTGQTAADAGASAEAIKRWIAKQPKAQRRLLDYYLYGLPAATATGP